MEYHARSAWGAPPPKWNPGQVNPSLGVFIHYNGPPVSGAVLAGDYAAVRTFLQGIQRYHMDSNGWPDIAYSWCVDGLGRIWELRGWGTAQAATMDWNWKSHSIFLPLGGDQKPTPEQITGANQVIAEHNRRYGNGFVKGHQQAPNQTSCPGPQVLSLINAGAFNPGATAPTPTTLPEDEEIMAPPVMIQNKNNIEIYYRYKEQIIHEHPNGTLWLLYPGTPYRVQVRKQDLPTFKYLGVKVEKVDQKTADWFWSYNVRQAPPRIHVRTPEDVARYQYMGVKIEKVDDTQAEFFQRYSQPVAPLTK